jgi:preprotein translocase subunit Sec63
MQVPPPPEPDPFEVLGLTASASEDELKKAFRALIVQYHPDKVAHLAPEFRDLAEKRTRELTAAYDLAQRRLRGD